MSLLSDFQTGLVSFLTTDDGHMGGGDAPPTNIQTTPLSQQAIPTVTVIDRWKRVVGQDWVIGVEIHNATKMSIICKLKHIKKIIIRSNKINCVFPIRLTEKKKGR